MLTICCSFGLRWENAAPFGANWSDWLVTELLHIAMLTALGWVTPNFGAVVNLFYLATFPLAMLSALWVLRHFGIPWPAAIAAAILYAFLLYHFSRATHHLSLSAYFLVPFAAAVAVWVAERRELMAIARRRITITRPFGVIALVTCLLTAISGVYYAFFAVFFLGVAACIATARERSRRAWITPVILAGDDQYYGWLTLLPTRIHAMRHGPNTEAVKRSAIELGSFFLPGGRRIRIPCSAPENGRRTEAF
jgi:phosphoglycerol transferase